MGWGHMNGYRYGKMKDAADTANPFTVPGFASSAILDKTVAIGKMRVRDYQSWAHTAKRIGAYASAGVATQTANRTARLVLVGSIVSKFVAVVGADAYCSGECRDKASCPYK